MVVLGVEIPRKVFLNLNDLAASVSEIAFVNVEPFSCVTILAKNLNNFLNIPSIILRELLWAIAPSMW